MLCLYYVANQDLVDRYKNDLLITAANIEAPSYIQHMQQFSGMMIQTLLHNLMPPQISLTEQKKHMCIFFTMTSACTELLHQTGSY